eukprot:360600-Chlamydomonas_euryale.AAC.9
MHQALSRRDAVSMSAWVHAESASGSKFLGADPRRGMPVSSAVRGDQAWVHICPYVFALHCTGRAQQAACAAGQCPHRRGKQLLPAACEISGCPIIIEEGQKHRMRLQDDQNEICAG